MSKNDMRMNIHIDGDNKGFKKALGQTKRDINQFEKQQQGGLGMSDLLTSQLLFSGKIGQGLGKARNAMMTSAFNPFRNRMEKGLNTSRNLSRAGEISQKHGNTRQALAFSTMSIAQSKKNEKLIAQAQMSQKAIMAGGIAATGAFAALKGTAATGAIAAAAAAAAWKMSSYGRQQAVASRQFSAVATLAMAQKEQRDIIRKVELGNTDMHSHQQKRLIEAQERSEQAGAAGFGYLATEAQIDFNNFVAALKEFTAGVLGSDDITAKGVAY